MSVIVYQFQTVKFIQMMSLTFGLFTQVSGSGPLGPLVCDYFQTDNAPHSVNFFCLSYFSLKRKCCDSSSEHAFTML